MISTTMMMREFFSAKKIFLFFPPTHLVFFSPFPSDLRAPMKESEASEASEAGREEEEREEGRGGETEKGFLLCLRFTWRQI